MWFLAAIALAGEAEGPAAALLAEVDAEVTALRAAWQEAPAPGDPAWVARRLKHLRAVDQVIRRGAHPPADWPEAERDALWDGLGERMRAADAAHTAEVASLVDAHGWFRVSVFGQEAAHDAWLLVQHADADPAFQERVLGLMAPLVATGEAAGKDYAYLYDRVAVNRNRPQRYGSQGSCNLDTGHWTVAPLEEPDRVDRHRAEVGLGSLADYASRFDCAGVRAAADAAYERSDWTACADGYAGFAKGRIGEGAATAWYNAACCAARAGMADAAFGHLTRSVEAGWTDAEHPKNDPDLEALRRDPRWAAWLAAIPQAAPPG